MKRRWVLSPLVMFVGTILPIVFFVIGVLWVRDLRLASERPLVRYQIFCQGSGSLLIERPALGHLPADGAPGLLLVHDDDGGVERIVRFQGENCTMRLVLP